MGSRVMHYCIASLLSKELQISDSQFFLGGIAPDVNKNMNSSKKISHFIKTDSEGRVFADYGEFKNKYLVHIKDPFYLGYFYHLVSDVIWGEEIYNKKIKWLPQPDKKEAQLKYYRDFWRLNGKLIDYYCLQIREMDVKANEIEEIDYKYLPDLIKDLEVDFAMKDEAKEQELEILRFDEVVNILELSVRKCLAIPVRV